MTINSDIPDAEVEIDGGFIGNTPSTANSLPERTRSPSRAELSTWSRDLERAARRHSECESDVEEIGLRRRLDADAAPACYNSIYNLNLFRCIGYADTSVVCRWI